MIAHRFAPMLLLALAPLVAQTAPSASPPASPPASPYAGLESRPIKALSDEQIRAYVDGEGMGFAMAAELNGYPGPRHVLELAEELALDDAQAGRTRAVFDGMRSEARALGLEIVDLESRLDAEFARNTIDLEALAELVSEIADRSGRLRIAHLRAHLAMVEILDERQVARYAELRGYRTGEGSEHPAGHHPGRHGGG